VEPVVPGRDATLTAQRQQQVKDAVDTWSGQLIDLGGRNELLYYRDLKPGTLCLDDADPVGVDALMDGRTAALSRLFGSAGLDDRLKRARAIRNKSREGLEERGIATCFVAIGMAIWSNTRETAKPAAPVLLREASIAAASAAEEDFEIALTGETDVNPTLLHLLEDQFGVRVDDEDLLALIEPARFDPRPVVRPGRDRSRCSVGFRRHAETVDRHVLLRQADDVQRPGCQSERADRARRRRGRDRGEPTGSGRFVGQW
jgi:hypothetical protein